MDLGHLLKKHKKIFILFLALIISLPSVGSWIGRTEVTEPDGRLHFYAFNVGQGDSSLFILPDGKTILIDAGPENAGKKLVSELKKIGIKNISLLVATHPHSDHIGGMKKILSNFHIDKVWDSGFIHGSQLQKNFYSTIKKKDIPFGRPKRGYSEKIGDVLIEVLGPEGITKDTKQNANNSCIVLNIKYGRTNFLMLADMEREERQALQPLPGATVLKASHHGSRNGTNMSLLKEVGPFVIILSYDKNNSYGYPHKEVVDAISASGIKRLDTKNGTVIIISDGEKISYSQKKGI